ADVVKPGSSRVQVVHAPKLTERLPERICSAAEAEPDRFRQAGPGDLGSAADLICRCCPGGQITSLFPIAISALCPVLGAKIFFFRFSEFCALLSPFRSDCRGALRVVTNAERNAVDANVPVDERHGGGR